MGYRFVKITGYYRDFLDSYYRRFPGITKRDYAEQHRHLMDQCFGWSDYYARHLRGLGVEADEIVYNAGHLQGQWAKEHGVSGGEKEILIAQLQHFKPDVIFFQDSIKLNGQFVTYLREKIPSLRQAIGFCCSPFGEDHLKQFQAFDYVIVCSPHFQTRLSNAGLKTYLMYHAFEESLLSLINISNDYNIVDFIFLGSLIPGSDGHGLRKIVLDYLIDSNVHLDIYAHLQKVSFHDLFFRRSAYFIVQALRSAGLGKVAEFLPMIKKACSLNELPQSLKNIRKIEQRAHLPIYGLEMFKALSRAKIGFNIHGDVGGDFAANVRLFEVTGVGSCMVTDWKRNMPDLFEPDTEAVTYRSAEECVEKVTWLVNHPVERQRIAERGQRKTLSSHTYRQRAARLHEIILQHM